jgi:hypothetical protein
VELNDTGGELLGAEQLEVAPLAQRQQDFEALVFERGNDVQE